MYLGVFQPADYVFGDYFGVPRYVDSQEKILTEIMVCSSVLTVLGGFVNHLVCFLGLSRCVDTLMSRRRFRPKS